MLPRNRRPDGRFSLVPSAFSLVRIHFFRCNTSERILRDTVGAGGCVSHFDVLSAEDLCSSDDGQPERGAGKWLDDSWYYHCLIQERLPGSGGPGEASRAVAQPAGARRLVAGGTRGRSRPGPRCVPTGDGRDRPCRGPSRLSPDLLPAVLPGPIIRLVLPPLLLRPGVRRRLCLRRLVRRFRVRHRLGLARVVPIWIPVCLRRLRPGSLYGGYPYGYYYDNRGAARLEVRPREAQVFIDGYFVGAVDDFDGWAQRLYVAPGEHELAISLKGHHTYRQSVLFRPGATLRLEHVLQPLAPGNPEDPRPEPESDGPPRPVATRPAGLSAAADYPRQSGDPAPAPRRGADEPPPGQSDQYRLARRARAAARCRGFRGRRIVAIARSRQHHAAAVRGRSPGAKVRKQGYRTYPPR